MRNLQTKIAQTQEALGKTLEVIGLTQEIFSELIEKTVIDPRSISKLGQLAIQAEMDVDALLKEFARFTDEIKDQVKNADERSKKDATPVQIYAPSRHSTF